MVVGSWVCASRSRRDRYTNLNCYNNDSIVVLQFIFKINKDAIFSGQSWFECGPATDNCIDKLPMHMWM